MQSVNEKFDQAAENKYYINIMYRIANKNLLSVCTKEEIKCIVMSTLWKCVSQYDPQKSKAQFSSYLYKSIENNTRRIYKNKIKIKNSEVELHPFYYSKKQETNDKSKQEAFEILESIKDLDKELYDILISKFYYNMTNQEIGKLNGYGKETARKKVKKAIELARKIVYN